MRDKEAKNGDFISGVNGKFFHKGTRKHKYEMNTVEKFEGDWVRIEEVMLNPKNRQMWDLWIQKVEFGIWSSRKEICRM